LSFLTTTQPEIITTTIKRIITPNKHSNKKKIENGLTTKFTICSCGVTKEKSSRCTVILFESSSSSSSCYE
jgi:hypothetical protein